MLHFIRLDYYSLNCETKAGKREHPRLGKNGSDVITSIYNGRDIHNGINSLDDFKTFKTN